jgi:hypothetical protein
MDLKDAQNFFEQLGHELQLKGFIDPHRFYAIAQNFFETEIIIDASTRKAVETVKEETNNEQQAILCIAEWLSSGL